MQDGLLQADDLHGRSDFVCRAGNLDLKRLNGTACKKINGESRADDADQNKKYPAHFFVVLILV